MLEQLTIKNFAIIEDIDISFKRGMNVILGETGAGKSIIIDALALLKGERSSFEKIRAGSQKAFIDGKFVIDNQEVIKLINEEYDDLIENGELIVTRTLDINGRSTIRLNGRMFSSSVTKSIMNEIIDIHSQHQNLVLLDEREHRNLLDRFIGPNEIYTKYQKAYNQYVKEQKLLEELENKVIDEAEMEYKKAQIADIENLNLQVGELNMLESLERKMANFVRLQETINSINELLDSDDGAITRVYQSRRLLDYLKDEDYNEYSTKLNDIYYNLQDINEALKDNLNNLNEYEYSPEYISERIYNIKKIMRKYGQEEKDIFEAYESLKKDILLMSDYEYALNKQKEITNSAYNLVLKCGMELTNLRKKYGIILAKEIDQELSDLALNNAHFKVNINNILPKSSGCDDVTFYISSNIGMPYGPLKDIASGGESSRIMLGLKTIFSKLCLYETMIFDEIDAGVSGRVASSMGRKIHEIGKNRQVIVISHIPQVCAFADSSLEVHKIVENNTTKTEVCELNDSEFILSIAKLLTDGNISQESLNLAKELVNNSRK